MLLYSSLFKWTQSTPSCTNTYVHVGAISFGANLGAQITSAGAAMKELLSAAEAIDNVMCRGNLRATKFQLQVQLDSERKDKKELQSVGRRCERRCGHWRARRTRRQGRGEENAKGGKDVSQIGRAHV